MKARGLSFAQVLNLRKDIQQQLEQLQQDVQAEQYDQRHGLRLVDSSEVRDRSEEAATNVANFASLTHISYLQQEIRDCELALQRIETGDYGICGVCNDDVELNRLTAYPMATLCLACQYKEEQRRTGRYVAAF